MAKNRMVKKKPNAKDAELVLSAIMVRQRAHAPYSKYKVGAAVRGKSGRIYSGCNVENRSYGLTVCAERNAIAHAVAHGERDFDAIAVATESDPAAAPCGACREVLAEFAPDVRIILVSRGKVHSETRLGKLFPAQFVLPS